MNKIMKYLLVVAVVLAGCMIVFSSTCLIIDSFQTDDCKIALTAPDLFQPGQLIELDASASMATELAWGILPATANFKVIDDGKRAIFTGTGDQKVYTIIITGWRNGKLVQIFHVLTLGYDSKIAVTDLQKKIISWLPVDRTHDDVIKLAQAFNSIARIIENGTLTDPANIVEATAWSTSDALGKNAEQWEPFLKKLQEYLVNSPPTNHAATWREIARALEASDGAA